MACCGEERRYIPLGVCDIERICERVARRACNRVRALRQVWERRLERLDEVLIRLLRIGSGGRSVSQSVRGQQVHGRPRARAHHSTLAARAAEGICVPVAKHGEQARGGRTSGSLGASRSRRGRDVGGGLSRGGYERSRLPRGSSQRSSHRALVHARSCRHGPTLTWDAKGAWHRKRAVGSRPSTV
jgi:hypothetical protein